MALIDIFEYFNCLIRGNAGIKKLTHADAKEIWAAMFGEFISVAEKPTFVMQRQGSEGMTYKQFMRLFLINLTVKIMLNYKGLL